MENGWKRCLMIKTVIERSSTPEFLWSCTVCLSVWISCGVDKTGPRRGFFCCRVYWIKDGLLKKMFHFDCMLGMAWPKLKITLPFWHRFVQIHLTTEQSLWSSSWFCRSLQRVNVRVYASEVGRRPAQACHIPTDTIAWITDGNNLRPRIKHLWKQSSNIGPAQGPRSRASSAAARPSMSKWACWAMGWTEGAKGLS